MKPFLWFVSFLLLCIAAVTGLGVGINALSVDWIAVTLLCIAGMFSAAEYADTI